jgi:hypothetical protein
MEDLMDITEDSENEKNSRLDKPVKKGGIDWAAAAKDMTFVDEGDVAEVQGAVALRKPGKERFFQVHPNEADYSSALQVLEVKEDMELRGDYLVHPELSTELSAFLQGQLPPS